MEIIKNYWGSKEEEEKSENQFLNHIGSHEIKKVFIAFEEIKNFKISIEKNRMILRYALRKNAKLKYYVNLLNHSIAVNKNNAVFLEDINYIDYENGVITKETLNLLN